ncbi:hypothetical protein [Thalassotalea atypica]|uniref:hypothetical protein n=1 Tax=Thalassotalea atypica TaxID=2054316 RepID=UPI0025726D4D|nr:hypothetical protein [Thalassotalea atypica]
MNKNSISQFIGVIVSIIVILVLNKFTIVDNCLDHGGQFNYQTGKCILANSEIYTAEYTNYLIALYFLMGILVAYVTSKFIRKALSKN